MAKAKKSVSQTSLKTIVNLEIVLVILVGAVTLMTLAILILYHQRELISDEAYLKEDAYMEQSQQLEDLKMQMEEKTVSPTPASMSY